MADARLKGQEVEIRCVAGGSVVAEIASIATFNDNTKFEIKEDGFLGEVVNQYDEVLNGYGGDFEFQVNDAKWWEFEQLIEARAKREQPALVFNIVRTDFFANGSSAVVTYNDVKWGGMPQSLGGRGEFLKIKAEFATGDRSVQINSLP